MYRTLMYRLRWMTIIAAVSMLGLCFTVTKAFTPIAYAETPEEYVELGFGLFPHYGINTYTNGLTGREGSDPVSVNYPSTLFNPTDFDANQWAKAASDAGMKYIIYTVKHHFGWSGWDSAYSTYDVATSSVPNLDTVQEVKDAADYYGLKLVLYYSALDRTNFPDPKIPGQDWTNKNANYTQFVKNQMTELLTNYGTITGVWFDAAKAITHAQAVEIKNHIKSIQPDTLVMFHHKLKDDISDVRIKEQVEGLPPATNQIPWENAWYLNSNTNDRYWSFSNNVTPQLSAVQIAAQRDLLNNRNASYALGASPGPNGKLPTAIYDRLVQVGNYPPPQQVAGDDADPAIAYTGSWSHIARTESYNGTLSYSNTLGATASYTFNGTGVELYTQKGPGGGKFDIYLDNVKVLTYDSYASSMQHRVLAYQTIGLTAGSHTIKIVVTHTKHASSSNYTVHVDYIKALESTLTFIDVDNTDENIDFVGNWDSTSRAQSYEETISYSNTTNDYAEYAFSGTGVKLYTQKGPSAGKFNIYLDNVLQTTYDSYASQGQHQVLALDVQNLTASDHTIKIVVNGTKNTNSNNYFVHLDYLKITND
jgi:hypothetical protein